MASANIYSIDNPPDFEFFANNKNGKDIRCLNYVFRLKTAGKRSWNYLCSSPNCTASLSLQAISETKISEPFTIVRLNLKHRENSKFTREPRVTNMRMPRKKMLELQHKSRKI